MYSYLVLAHESRILGPVLRSVGLSALRVVLAVLWLVGRGVWLLAFVPYVFCPASVGWMDWLAVVFVSWFVRVCPVLG
jgi:uncharacterized membrane protein (DUF441 family)